MAENIKKLLSISSNLKSDEFKGGFKDAFPYVGSDLISELEFMLAQKNGFLAFESALNVFTSTPNDLLTYLEAWNSPDGWKSLYSPIVDKVLFFAEDIFGNQYGMSDDYVVKFEPESGKLEYHSSSLEEWAKNILSDYDYETGWSLAREWQLKNGKLRGQFRLLPKIPFSIGGKYEAENLTAIEENKAMNAYGELYNAIKNTEDGQQITLDSWIN